MKSYTMKARKMREPKVYRFNATFYDLTLDDIRDISEEAYRLVLGKDVQIKRF